MAATYQRYHLALETHTRDLEERVHTLELGAAALEASIERRWAQVKAEITCERWETRLKVALVISWGVAVASWVVAIASWAR